MKNSDGVRAIYATSAGALFYVLAATFTSERGVANGIGAGLKFQNPNAYAEWSRRGVLEREGFGGIRCITRSEATGESSSADLTVDLAPGDRLSGESERKRAARAATISKRRF